MKIEWLHEAQREYHDFLTYYLTMVGEKYARRFSERILGAVSKLEDTPELGVLKSDTLMGKHGFRALFIEQYVCVYKIIEDTVYIYHLADARKKLYLSDFWNRITTRYTEGSGPRAAPFPIWRNTMKKLKRLTSLILALVLCAGMMGHASAADMGNFTDVDPAAWYYEAVGEAVDNGLLIGKGEGVLDPMGSLTRAEMAAVINRAFGTYVAGDISRFTDVPEDAWYYDEIAMAYHMGTYVGAGEDTMAPEADITRQEAMTVVARALQLDLENYGDTSLSAFADAGAISGWALPYVRAMV